MDKRIIKRLYRKMMRIRMIEEAIAEEYHKQEMRCPTHLYIGQEAIAAGVSENLKKSDVVFSTHRSHGHYIAKGGNIKRMIAEIYGKETGCCGGIGGSQHLIDLSVNYYGSTPIVGETIPVAAGVALSMQMRGEKAISVVYFGEAATEEGVFAESLNFAALKKLPVLFVCENNLYSVNTHISLRQPKKKITDIARANMMKSYSGDGNDVSAVYGLVKKAVRWVRRGRGPAFLEFFTYRQREHCGVNMEPEGFRPKQEFEYWERKSAIKRISRYVLQNHIMTEEEMNRLKKSISKEIEEALEFGRKSPYPRERLTERMVYA